MKIGIQELLLVFVVALIVLGPDKLPLYARKLGEALREFRRFSSDAVEALKPVEELGKEVSHEMEEIRESLTDVGKASEEGRIPEPELSGQSVAGQQVI